MWPLARPPLLGIQCLLSRWIIILSNLTADHAGGFGRKPSCFSRHPADPVVMCTGALIRHHDYHNDHRHGWSDKKSWFSWWSLSRVLWSSHHDYDFMITAIIAAIAAQRSGLETLVYFLSMTRLGWSWSRSSDLGSVYGASGSGLGMVVRLKTGKSRSYLEERLL